MLPSAISVSYTSRLEGSRYSKPVLERVMGTNPRCRLGKPVLYIELPHGKPVDISLAQQNSSVNGLYRSFNVEFLRL